MEPRRYSPRRPRQKIAPRRMSLQRPVSRLFGPPFHGVDAAMLLHGFRACWELPLAVTGARGDVYRVRRWYICCRAQQRQSRR